MHSSIKREGISTATYRYIWLQRLHLVTQHPLAVRFNPLRRQMKQPLTDDIADEWYSEDHGGTGFLDHDSDVDEILQDDYSENSWLF